MKALLEKNKVFTYMVVHDVKHPITALLANKKKLF